MWEKITIEVFYSEEDEGYIARVLKMETLSAFGRTIEEALENLVEVIELCKEEGLMEDKD